MVRHTLERRKYGRIHPDPPLRGSLDAVPVFVAEISVSGARLLHENRLPRGNGLHQLWFDWQEHTIRFQCEFVRTTIIRLAKKADETSLYETGVHFVSAVGESDALVRELIGDYVVRALNEQLANARGIPPLAAYSYQTGKGDRYRRCELLDGTWRKAETTNPQQPERGFTIAADVESYDIDVLCKTWEHCDDEGKRLTQLLAQLSISKGEGIPTRRYIP